MKQYYYQFSTGAVFMTPQVIHYNSVGYAIDSQSTTDEDCAINGTLQLTKESPAKKVYDMQFRASDIVISWHEIIKE